MAGTQVVVAQLSGDVAEDSAALSWEADGGGIALAAPATRYVTVAIESLAEGDEVLARGEADAEGDWSPFTVDRVFRRWTRHLRFLTVRGSDGTSQELVTTDEHPVYDPAVGDWVEAGTLHVGDQLCEAGGGIATVESTRREEHPGGVEVFNMRVAEAHTYLVRAEGFDGEPVWVHNASYTSKGALRDNEGDWRALRDSWDANGYGHILSTANRKAIAGGLRPVVDAEWLTGFPGDAHLMGTKIIPHHVGGYPLTVMVPAPRHLNAHMPGGYRYNPGGPGQTG